jgi:hypothetical protein
MLSIWLHITSDPQGRLTRECFLHVYTVAVLGDSLWGGEGDVVEDLSMWLHVADMYSMQCTSSRTMSTTLCLIFNTTAVRVRT